MMRILVGGLSGYRNKELDSKMKGLTIDRGRAPNRKAASHLSGYRVVPCIDRESKSTSTV